MTLRGACRFGLAGLSLATLFGLAVAFWPESSSYAIDQPDRVFDDLPVGVHQISYRIHNLSDRPMRVLGAEFT